MNAINQSGVSFYTVCGIHGHTKDVFFYLKQSNLKFPHRCHQRLATMMTINPITLTYYHHWVHMYWVILDPGHPLQIVPSLVSMGNITAASYGLKIRWVSWLKLSLLCRIYIIFYKVSDLIFFTQAYNICITYFWHPKKVSINMYFLLNLWHNHTECILDIMSLS